MLFLFAGGINFIALNKTMMGRMKKDAEENSADMSINIDSKPFTLINLPVID